MDNVISTTTTRPKSASMFASRFWRKTAFQIVIAACLTFVVVTILAMLVYAGGTGDDPQSVGYSFFTNFFSDLGRTISHSGASNTLSALLFFGALTFAGVGLALFFIAFLQFFSAPRWARILSIIGSLFGIGSALCFVGVALTPANLLRAYHGQFVLWAFGLFPLAVICYIPLLWQNKAFPKRYAFAFIAFAALLILYFVLIRSGPRGDTPESLLIQATGQKIIVYASILSILFQATGALRVNSET